MHRRTLTTKQRKGMCMIATCQDVHNDYRREEVLSAILPGQTVFYEGFDPAKWHTLIERKAHEDGLTLRKAQARARAILKDSGFLRKDVDAVLGCDASTQSINPSPALLEAVRGLFKLSQAELAECSRGLPQIRGVAGADAPAEEEEPDMSEEEKDGKKKRVQPVMSHPLTDTSHFEALIAAACGDASVKKTAVARLDISYSTIRRAIDNKQIGVKTYHKLSRSLGVSVDAIEAMLHGRKPIEPLLTKLRAEHSPLDVSADTPAKPEEADVPDVPDDVDDMEEPIETVEPVPVGEVPDIYIQQEQLFGRLEDFLASTSLGMTDVLYLLVKGDIALALTDEPKDSISTAEMNHLISLRDVNDVELQHADVIDLMLALTAGKIVIPHHD